MEVVGRQPPKKLTLKTFLRVFTHWPVYLFSFAFTSHVMGIRVFNYFNLFLKAAKSPSYSVVQVNVLPTGGYGLQIFFTLGAAWISDAIRARSPAIIGATIPSLIGTIILWVYPDQNRAAMLAGWYLTYAETGPGSLFLSWLTELTNWSAEHRVIVIGVVETVAMVFSAWLPLIIYNTAEAPRFSIGYKMAAMFLILEIAFTLLIVVMERKVGEGPNGRREKPSTEEVER